MDFATRRIVAKLEGFDGRLDTRAVAFSPDDRFLAAKGGSQVIVWSTATWKQAVHLRGKQNFNHNNSVIFSPDSGMFGTRIDPPGEGAKESLGMVGFWRTSDWSQGEPLIDTGRGGAIGTVLV